MPYTRASANTWPFIACNTSPAVPARLPPGRWRAYADVLAGPFAALAPVAARLGYPDA